MLSGRTVGDLVSEAIRAYLQRAPRSSGRSSLADLVPEDYSEGQERLSEQVDGVVYDA